MRAKAGGDPASVWRRAHNGIRFCPDMPHRTARWNALHSLAHFAAALALAMMLFYIRP